MFDDAQKVVEFVIGEPSPWRIPRIVIGAVVGAVLILIWKCSEVVGPNEQAYRMMFGRAKFIYKDSGEGSRWKRRKERQINRRKVRELRKGPLSNQPHLQLEYGEPKRYGPGRYFRVPFTVLSFVKMDATPKNIDFDVIVEWPGQSRGTRQPIQLVIRVADMFLWDLSTQDVEGTLNGIAKEVFRQILEQLGADTYIADAERVKHLFIEQCKEEFARYGAAIERVNIGASNPITEGWIASAIRDGSNIDSSVIGGVIVARTNGTSLL